MPQDEEKEEAPRKLYADREEWKDVQPIEQTEISNPLIPIFYPPDYKDALDYFRGVVATEERSERVLELTEHIIRMNPAHYSVWQYRYETLLALNSPLDKELKLMDELALANMKFYQVWHHRKLIMMKYKKPLPDLSFIAKVLTADVKNYHTWQYRQWLLTYFDDEELWRYELPFVDILLKEDIRNNSAWHHRFFVVFDSGVRDGDEDRAMVVRRELNYAKQKIALSPNNLSAWNYLRGILNKTETKFSSIKSFVIPYTLPQQQKDTEEEEYLDLDNPLPSSSATLPCALAMEFLADIYEEEGDVTRATELLTGLAEEHDTMRKRYETLHLYPSYLTETLRYWDYRVKSVKERLGPSSAVPTDS
ncbi:CAAX geranylgeranyltransferase alpha subunit [Serendipita sp. 399]|nr:CAAX geranylgeranyltransferase alpha subunit [Serendipita sp. 399]